MVQAQTSRDVEDRSVTPEEQPGSSAPRDSQQSARASRKRTKTGCLTCRKRRIKCGEERPTCNNCIKSKRECEGYNQRVVFKPSGGAHYLSGQAPTGPVPLAPLLGPGYSLPISSTTSRGNLLWSNTLNPRQLYEQSYSYPTSHSAHYNTASALSTTQQYAQNTSSFAQYAPSTAGGWEPQLYASNNTTYELAQPSSHRTEAINSDQFESQIAQYDYNPTPLQVIDTAHNIVQTKPPDISRETPNVSESPVANEYHGSHASEAPRRIYTQHSVPSAMTRKQSSISEEPPNFSSSFASASKVRNSISRDNDYVKSGNQNNIFKQEPISPVDVRRRSSIQEFQQQSFFDTALPATAVSLSASFELLEEDDMEDDNDDPWDIEMELEESVQRAPDDTQHDMSIMLSRHATQDLSRQKTFQTFLNNPNILASYRPSHATSPLTDEKSAQIFCHFVAVTGPCISIFERHAAASSTSTFFNNIPVSSAQKALWTYTLPSMALSHPPLMHSLLALSSLHIAKLQQTSDAPSIKHFTYALRRVSKLIALPKRRNEIPTLAANLLVGFYEIMLADHSKWNIHLGGAKILVMEIDFAGMTRRLRRMRLEARARIAHASTFSYEEPIRIAGIPETLIQDKDWEIDEGLISNLTGYNVEYDKQWQVRTNTPVPVGDMSAKDIEDYKLRSDLYWWYCKQDIFQSMVSNNRLLMPYEHWIFCPPRGQIGKLDRTYATMDHLCLIMARLTDFGGKDQLRKRKVIAARGGQWRPPPGFFGPGKSPTGAPSTTSSTPTAASASAFTQGPTGKTSFQQAGGQPQRPPELPTATPPQPSTSSTPAPGGVPMYGMMPPPTGPVKMHSAFQSMNAAIYDTGYPPPSQPTPMSEESQNLDAATSYALAEHASIISAFDLFSRSLGEEYAQLAPDTAPPISTPFGPALQYRTFPIACIWAFYHVGRILLHRLHPHMPPAAMVSAGVTAHLTHEHAQTVGKICAGLYCPQSYSLQTGNLNPSLGAALMESSFSMFFAGVQFRDPVQRGWTVNKLNTIARITGWRTSSSIAAGCEVCWEKMGQMGRGPPYTPTMARERKDEREAGKVRRGESGEGWGTPTVKSEGVKMEEEEEPNPLINHDRKFIRENPNARVHWALGIMGVDEDMKRLDLGQP